MLSFARSLLGADEPVPQDDLPKYGYRIIHAEPDQPAAMAGLEALFDFIIAINGHDISGSELPQRDDVFQGQLAEIEQGFVAEIANCDGRSVRFTAWSSKGRVSRDVILSVHRSTNAGSTSDGEISQFGFGMTLQWTPLEVADHIWHVLDVQRGSPAEKAGLVAHSDYIVAAQGGLLAAGGESLLGRVIHRYAEVMADPAADPPDSWAAFDRTGLELYVYNADHNVVRPVKILPSSRWGGDGLLGCGVGYGLLHRLPARAAIAPGDTMFDSTEDSTMVPTIVPALSIPPPPVPSATGHVRAKKKTRAQDMAELASYLDEEQKKSRELDVNTGAGAASEAGDLPPPPKTNQKS